MAKGENAGSAATSAGQASKPEQDAALPPLKPDEFKAYNRVAEKMDYFHDHFRKTWTVLHTACANNKRPANMTLKQFIDEGLLFVQYLTAHHSIEETYLFPMLARKMPEFRAGENAELLAQHREIHEGMDAFEAYLRKCLSKEVAFEMGVLKEKMDNWGDVLWKHLDQEVKTLGAENMRRYWTLGEIKSFPI